MSNEKSFEIGQKVTYYPVLGNKDISSEQEVASEPWVVCGEKVVKLTGKSGGFSLENLEAI